MTLASLFTLMRLEKTHTAMLTMAHNPKYDIKKTYKCLFTSPPPAGPFSLSVKFLQVYTVPHEGWGISSVCPTCTSAYSYSTLASGVWAPYVNGLQQPKSMGFSVGETPVFKSVFPYPAGYAGYCTMLTSAGSSGPTLLAFNGHADLWSVCANNTASGRLDIVYSPVSGHAHYSLSDCSAVTLQLV
ncbi:hypothetical protein BDQ12DRAFT_707832 [Crucibulum laeve]|uniref:Uncharacterized protein n=1 Tax=Crucibulum laeve TaxID=68775 RepID=A0A5C3LJ59_9AGAR|nr:hypothetical protein BDQ12DRAFT_707832 [Crucibulum laeve]